jgi:exopolysaccharide biosynthesis protein
VSRSRRVLLVSAATLLPVLAGLAQPAAAAPGNPAPFAPNTAGLHWSTQSVAPGVTVVSGSLTGGPAPSWTVTIDATVTSKLTGQPAAAELGSPQWAHSTVAQLAAAGFTAQVTPVNWPSSYTDTPHGLQGDRVRVGSFGTQAAATAEATALHTAGFPTAAAEYTGYDPDRAPDVEQVHVAIVDPSRFTGTVDATHGTAVAQRTTTSALAKAAGALVATNGGFFVTADSDGFQGVPSGLAAYDGAVQAESSGSRAALVLDHGRPSIRNLTSVTTVRSGAATHDVQGVNRKPGVVRDCGRPDSAPTTQPRQDITCTSTDEIVEFTAQFGAALPSGTGTQVLLDAHGTVLSVGADGGQVPAGGSALQGIGGSASWLAAHAAVGRKLTIGTQVRDTTGRPLPLNPAVSVISAAPVLVRNGRPAIDAATEGVIDPTDASFNYGWGEERQPRTMAGIDAHGRLLLVTVDGREPGQSDGVTLDEGAQLMRALGAVSALNLDGGGSSAMAVDGNLINHPSDATGERPIGDAVLVLPRR